MKLLAYILIIGTASAADQATLALKNGSKRTGEIVFADEHQIRLKIGLGEQGNATATVSIPRADLDSIDFAIEPSMEELISSPTPSHTAELDALWIKFGQWLAIPHSHAGRIGCSLGEALLASTNSQSTKKALEIFKEVEAKAWSQQDKERAKMGRLQAMLASGKASVAMSEAKELAVNKENATLLIQAKLIMAQARHKDFLKFLKENPRWNEDPLAIPERHQIYNEVLELYLYPALFFGSDSESAARGLWGAVDIYRTCGEIPLAIETSRDITTLYPDSPYASKATEFLSKLTPEQAAMDKEKAGREALAMAVSKPEPSPPTAPQNESPAPKKTKSTKKKQNGNQPVKN
mgnify:CR=1 FL=1